MRELDLCVSNFLVSTVEGFLDDVVVRADTDLVKHMRLAAVQRCIPLKGLETVGGWRDSAARYPDKLVERMVRRAATPESLAGWSGRDALLARGDLIAAHVEIGHRTSPTTGRELALLRLPV